MVDEEVESTLREIRERVRKRAEKEAEASRALSSNTHAAVSSSVEAPARIPEAMARIDAYLATTERAWDRLPPVVSNRSGGIARLELWVKRRFKQATRWYSWEQINFNAAVHHALRDTLDALQQLARAGAESEAGVRRLEIDTIRQRVEIESQRAALESQRAAMEAMRTEMEGEHRAQILEVMARLADLSRELSKHNEQRIGEQRVCFKQLSLEMSEAEVLLERTRRNLETRLAKLEAEVES